MARTKSTARPMTQEELIAAGLLPIAEEQEEQNVMGSGSREDGEIGSGEESGDEEDISNVDASVDELIDPKDSHPPTVVFGRSLTTPELIRSYEEKGFFPADHGRAPTSEETPTPQPYEVVVFRDFFTAGLRFPCDLALPSILDQFPVKMHQLTPNSFLELSKFFWI